MLLIVPSSDMYQFVLREADSRPLTDASDGSPSLHILLMWPLTSWRLMVALLMKIAKFCSSSFVGTATSLPPSAGVPSSTFLLHKCLGYFSLMSKTKITWKACYLTFVESCPSTTPCKLLACIFTYATSKQYADNIIGNKGCAIYIGG